MAHAHIGLCFGTSSLEIQVAEWRERPSLYIRFNHRGDWPAAIDGVPVVCISDIAPPALKDDAYASAIRWHQAASRLVGADGSTLSALECGLGMPLWWAIDLLLHDTVWLWIRAIESVHLVLTRYRPARVSVCGHDTALIWMRETALAVLRGSDGVVVDEVSLPTAVSLLAGHLNQASADEVLGAWNARLDAHAAFQCKTGARASSVCTEHALRLQTSDCAQWYARDVEASVNFVEVVLRWVTGSDESVAFELGGAAASQIVYLGAQELRLATGERVRLDTRREARYTLWLAQGRSFVYVDDVLRLQGKVLPGTHANVCWGHFEALGDCESDWSSVVWGRRSRETPRPAGFLQRLFGKMSARQQSSAVRSLREDRWALAPLLSVASRESGASAGGHRPPSPPQGAIAVIRFGDELRWFDDDGQQVLYDQLSDGIVEALEERGQATVQLTLNSINPRVPTALRERARLVELRGWRAKSAVPSVVERIRSAWRAWRGEPHRPVRFPLHRGVSIDAHLEKQVESVLPYLVNKVIDAEALEAFCRAHRPRAVVFTHFGTSQRQLVEAARRGGAVTVAPVIGCDSLEHLLYGIRDAASGCPRADIYTVWGEAGRCALEASGTFDVPLAVAGRPRHDLFSTRARRPSVNGWLQRLGLPQEVRHVVVFADVLCSTNHATILSSVACEALLRRMLAVLEHRPDVHIVFKPWGGDNLTEVRTVVGKIGSPKLHVIDPTSLPYHNLEVLQHALAVVSSPTSMLAEFAAMGGVPIALTLPETGYYHGKIIEDLFRPFSISVSAVDEIGDALRRAIARNEEEGGGLKEAERAGLARAFGPSDGSIGAGFVDLILQQMEAGAERG